MSMRNVARGIARRRSSLALASACARAQSPNLGKPISQEDLASWDISIGPDGAGLPPGSGTVQAGRGRLRGEMPGLPRRERRRQPNDRLVGGQGTLAGDKPPVKTVGSYWPYATTLFDYIRRAMPLNRVEVAHQ